MAVSYTHLREKFEKAWGVKLDPNIGTHATDVFPKAITGEIKGLYIYGEDPVVTDPDTTPVSYTHLDVYKRQLRRLLKGKLHLQQITMRQVSRPGKRC